MTFKLGQSGNPNGRPKGSRDKKAIIFEKITMEKGTELLKKGLEMALNGDAIMLKYFLNRMLPVKPKGVKVDLDFKNKKGYKEQCDLLNAALSDKDIDVDTYALLSNSITRTFEARELEDRVRNLEEKLNNGG